MFFVFCIAITNISYAQSEIGDLGPGRSIFSQLELSDVVMIGTIESVKTKVHPVTQEINFKITFKDVSTVESTGLVQLKQKAKLRFYGSEEESEEAQALAFDELVGQRVIAFVKDNGLVPVPLVGEGILYIQDDGTVTAQDGTQLLGVGEKGEPLTAKKYNACDLNDVGPVSGTINDPNDPNGPREMTRAELLDQISAFSCPENKGTWRRGGELPDDLRSPIKQGELISLLATHKKRMKLPKSDHKKLTNPSEESLQPLLANAKKLSPEAAGVWVKMLDDGIELPPNLIRKVQKMLEIRGESLPDRHMHLLSWII